MGIYVAKPTTARRGGPRIPADVLRGPVRGEGRTEPAADLGRRTAVAVGVLIAAFPAFLIHAATVAAPLFAQPPDVPSVSASAPSPQWAAAVDRARPMVRAAIVEQNLPGVSIAVGMGGGREHRLGRRVRMEGRRHAHARHAGYSIQHRHRGTCGHRRRGRVPRHDQHRH